jgi:cell shape-determining protein MreC
LSQPITATVVKIEREGRWNESKIVVIDKGSADGLRLGMILMGKALTDEEPTFLFDPRVISVEEHAARVEMNYNEHVKLGDWISTKFIPGPYYQWWAT